MWAESDGPGTGSTFSFTIVAPVAELPPSPAARLRRRAARAAGKRVLVVDDNATNRRVLSLQAAKWGMDARDTESPREALRWLDATARRFDLAILDMHMPEMDGVALARAHPRNATPGCRWCCSARSAGARRATPKRLFDAYLAKPIRQSQLFDTLVGLLAHGRRAKPRRTAPRPPQLDPGMAARHPLRILLAEDNVVNQKLALRLLQQMGYRADLASQRHRGDRVGGAPDLRRGADGRADARDGRPRCDAADLRALAGATSGRASSR